MQFRLLVVIILLTSPAHRCDSVLGREAQQPEVAEERGESEPDLLCGPRAVKYLLNSYGKDEDIFSLAREVQWPDVSKGSNLSSLASSLRKRGIHVRGFLLSEKATLTCDNPSIVHFPPKSDSEIGHFTVWLPTSDGSRTYLWAGLEGYKEIRTTEFNKERSGVVLVTSPDPIPEEFNVTDADHRSFRVSVLAVLGLSVVAVIFFVNRYKANSWKKGE